MKDPPTQSTFPFRLTYSWGWDGSPSFCGCHFLLAQITSFV